MERIVTSRMFQGIVHMQVCAERDVTDEEVLAHCNRDNPSGTSMGWTTVCREATEDWPNVAPVQCADDPNRLHLLVAC